MWPSLSPTQREIINQVTSKNHYKSILTTSPPSILSIAQQALDSCIHIVQDEFGSGFCFDPRGYILTCQHCIANTKKANFKLIFPNGELVDAIVMTSDKKLDLAVLKIIGPIREYPFLRLSEKLPGKGTKIFCIGQPAYEDLETEETGRKTNYTPFYLSSGKVQGYEKDLVYCSKKNGLGPLKHSCWTYWGHSGSPIISFDGLVVGVHNSWDESTGTRHGLSVETLQKFTKIMKAKFE